MIPIVNLETGREMRLCAIQQPYPYTPEESPAAVGFLMDELNRCDSSLNRMVTPGYSKCPASFPDGGIDIGFSHCLGLVAHTVRPGIGGI